MANRSIVNVLGCLIVISLISGCGGMPEKIEVSAKPVDKPRLVLPKADELNLRPVEWVILTEDNAVVQFEKLSASGRTIVFFAITDRGYENLGLNISDLRGYIQQQQSIIGAYRIYYQASDEAIDDANSQIEAAKTQVEKQQQNQDSSRGFWQKLTD